MSPLLSFSPAAESKGLLARVASDIPLVAVYNMAIGSFVAALTEYGLTTSLVFSYCIGFSIYLGVMGLCISRGHLKPEPLDGLVGIPLGFAVGFALAAWLMDFPLQEILQHHQRALLISAATALVFGVLGTWHFHDVGNVTEARDEARAERLRRAEREVAATHAELARLQAQIEPHFLFNTLSNVVGLIDTDPATARRMLLDLTSLLRTSLGRTRQAEVSLREELDLLRAYIDIMGVRMGARLQWTIDADETLLDARMPPLLVQPLVENAIRHGLEPKTTGGHLTLRCRREADGLVVEVEDDGIGFAPKDGAGVGLANVRERLVACYGEAANLAIEDAPGGGIIARLRLPIESSEPSCAS